jgi:hypothetical protein
LFLSFGMWLINYANKEVIWIWFIYLQQWG